MFDRKHLDILSQWLKVSWSCHRLTQHVFRIFPQPSIMAMIYCSLMNLMSIFIDPYVFCIHLDWLMTRYTCYTRYICVYIHIHYSVLLDSFLSFLVSFSRRSEKRHEFYTRTIFDKYETCTNTHNRKLPNIWFLSQTPDWNSDRKTSRIHSCICLLLRNYFSLP